VFNHINWGVQNQAMAIESPATAGKITSITGRPRQVQFGFRLIY
jgi:hypothetical protein